MISLNAVGVGFRRASEPHVLFTVTATVHTGSICVILGANGAGKSTLIKSILGFQPVVSGSILVDGLPPIAYRRRLPIGYLPEDGELPRSLTTCEFLRRVAFASGLRANAASCAVADAANTAGLDFSQSSLISTLSKGMKQRVRFAAALVPLPRVLLLDEPETGLDPMQRNVFRSTIRRLACDGMSILVSSHDFEGACTYAQQALVIRGTRCEVIDAVADLSATTLLALIADPVP